MKAYIAGKITGNPDYKRQFAAAEAYHRLNGIQEIFNPAADQPEGMSYKEYLDRDLKELMTCSMVFFLPNWEESQGARLEMAYAKAADLPVFIWSKEEMRKFMAKIEKQIKLCP